MAVLLALGNHFAIIYIAIGPASEVRKLPGVVGIVRHIPYPSEHCEIIDNKLHRGLTTLWNN